MFLLCNGLLVFVGITRSLSGSNSVDESSKYIEDIEAKESILVVKEIQEKTNEHDEEVEENAENIILKEEKMLFNEGDEEDKEIENYEFLIGESIEEEEDLEEANWVISNEELNKKFDDFIRRMKEDLRIEAQRQLIMV